MRPYLNVVTVMAVAMLLPANLARAEVISIVPIDDAFVTDSNRDGVGDFTINGVNSVLVGFDAFGSGEHRGVYEFDVSSIPRGSQIVSATLGLNSVGTRLSGTDRTLGLYAGMGNGIVDVSDFASGDFVARFIADDLGPFARFDNLLDLTPSLQSLLHTGGAFIEVTIRPNPLAGGTAGGILFSTNELGSLSSQFGPAELIVQFRHSVPAPATLLLLSCGLALVLWYERAGPAPSCRGGARGQARNGA